MWFNSIRNLRERLKMKELYVHFNFNVRVEVEDIDDVKDEIVEWWVSQTELPNYEIKESE